jgi:hypothetical protein
VCALVQQGDVGAHDEVADGSGGQDVPGSGGHRHPGRNVDGDAADVAVAEFHLAGVQPGPDLDADAAQLVPEGGRTADRSAGPVKGRQDAVAGGLDQLAAELLDQPPGQLVSAGPPAGSLARWRPRCR